MQTHRKLVLALVVASVCLAGTLLSAEARGDGRIAVQVGVFLHGWPPPVHVEVYVNGELRVATELSGGGLYPYPMVRMGDLVAVHAYWDSPSGPQHTKVGFTAEKKPERVRIWVTNRGVLRIEHS